MSVCVYVWDIMESFSHLSSIKIGPFGLSGHTFFTKKGSLLACNLGSIGGTVISSKFFIREGTFFWSFWDFFKASGDFWGLGVAWGIFCLFH